MAAPSGLTTFTRTALMWNMTWARIPTRFRSLPLTASKLAESVPSIPKPVRQRIFRRRKIRIRTRQLCQGQDLPRFSPASRLTKPDDPELLRCCVVADGQSRGGSALCRAGCEGRARFAGYVSCAWLCAVRGRSKPGCDSLLEKVVAAAARCVGAEAPRKGRERSDRRS